MSKKAISYEGISAVSASNVSKDIVITSKPKTSGKSKTVLVAFPCPISERDRADDLVYWLKREHGIHISRAKLMHAGTARMTKDEQTVEYIRKFLEENPDRRKS